MVSGPSPSAYVTLFVCTHFIFPTVPTYYVARHRVAKRCDYKIFAQPDSKATINGHLNSLGCSGLEDFSFLQTRTLNVVLRNGQTTPSKSVNGRLRRDPSNEVGRSSSLQALLTNFFLRREVSPLRVSFH
ncbi:hypothetical protein V8E54_009857 [Elaphomyces granulatus]